MNGTIVFPIIGAVISLAGVFIAIGFFKGKIQHNTESISTQADEIKTLASKDDLAAAIKRSDEMLAIMTKRAEEDRAKGQNQWREFHSIIAEHAGRIKVLENQQNTLMKSLDEIKGDIKDGFKQLQKELKELWNQKTHGSN